MAGIVDGDVIHCSDPRTGAATVDVPCTPVSAVPTLVNKAREARALWEDQGLKRRKWAIDDARQALMARAEELAALMAEELGRPVAETLHTSIAPTWDLMGWWLGNIDDLLTAWPLALNPLNFPRKRGRVRLEPLGVLGLITPWNLPVSIPLRTLVPGLLGGNAVVWKASEHTPRTSALLHDVLSHHLPDGTVALVQGGPEQGRAVVAASLDGVYFTGSNAVGEEIAERTARRMIHCSLELGGKDAAVVLPDAELDRAVAGITWAAYGFAGQNCAAVERCYVHRSVYDTFVEKAAAAASALRPFEDVGPLANPTQLAKVVEHVAEAVERGATVRAGGAATGHGWYHEPTVLTEVDEDMLVMKEETFGPVLAIVPFDDVEDAIARVNAHRYGLTTSIWTRDLDYGDAMAGSFECGVVTVNNHAFTGVLADGAWSGVKASGVGVTNSRFALYGMMRPRTIVVDALNGPDSWWFPYNDALVSLLRGVVELNRRGGDKLQGVRGAVTGLLNRWKT